MSVRLEPITDADLGRVVAFLERADMGSRDTDWTRALRVPWQVDAPNRGFMISDGDAIVGVYVAYYSEQELEGRRERMCNLGTWFVRPEYRMHSLRLLKAILAQDYNFTDLTPNEAVAKMNARLGFERLDTRGSLVPALPWLSLRRGSVTSQPAKIEGSLTGHELRLYRDHAEAAGALHMVARRGDRRCYVVARKVHYRRLPVLRLLHVSDPELFREMSGPIARHVLARYRAVAYAAENHVIEFKPRLSLPLRNVQQRMFRSDRLRPAAIGYLYTELTCLP